MHYAVYSKYTAHMLGFGFYGFAGLPVQFMFISNMAMLINGIINGSSRFV